MSNEERDPFEVRMELYEKRGRRLFAALASLAAAFFATVLVIVAGWSQIQQAMHEVRTDAQVAGIKAEIAAQDADAVAEKVEAVEDHTEANDKRLDAIGAPAPQENP